MTVRYTENGTLFTSWAIEDGDTIGPALMVKTVLTDCGENVLWLSGRNDAEWLNADAVEPAPNIIAVGPDGSDHEYGRALKAFARRHGVKRVYRFMDCGAES